MADVVHHEQYNKMNARNIAMIFAPNMTQVYYLFLPQFSSLFLYMQDCHRWLPIALTGCEISLLSEKIRQACYRTIYDGVFNIK